jgi:hypothetical protein
MNDRRTPSMGSLTGSSSDSERFISAHPKNFS